MKKIVRGNDFTLRIPVKKIVNGEQVAFPLPACTDIVVNIVNQYRRLSLSYAIDTAEDNIINARVEGDAVSVGTYALEVRGKIFGNDWRSKEYEQFQIVDNNASGDTAFNGELIEGEDSVEMNTALVILPPTAELTQLITDANTAIETAKQTDATLKANESERTEAEQQRASAEVSRVSAENKRSVSNEATRTANETARVAAEKQRATTFAELSENVDAAVSKANSAASAANTATDKATRVGLMNSTTIAQSSGLEKVTLWFGDTQLMLTCNKAISLLSAIEMYAVQCFDTTAKHKVSVSELTTVEEVGKYDITAGYPEKLEITTYD